MTSMPFSRFPNPGPRRRGVGDSQLSLNEADVVDQRVDADGFQRAEVQLLEVLRVRLQDHLKLVVVLQAVGVLAVATVGGRRLGWT